MAAHHIPERLSAEARVLFNNGRGYRDDTLFPPIPELITDKREPGDVVLTEVIACGKLEVCDTLLLHYEALLSRGDYRLLTTIVRKTREAGRISLGADGAAQLRGIVRRLTGECDSCLWLCAEPRHIYDCYIMGYIPKADEAQPGYAASCPDYEIKRTLGIDEYTARYVREVKLPEHITLLCDLGEAGMLVAMEGPDGR